MNNCKHCRHSDVHLILKPVKEYLICHNKKSDSYEYEAKSVCDKFEKEKK